VLNNNTKYSKNINISFKIRKQNKTNEKSQTKSKMANRYATVLIFTLSESGRARLPPCTSGRRGYFPL
jgi:hypothetical protein